METTIQLTEGKKLDIEYEVVKIAGQLAWFADALETNGNEPGADLIVRSIVKQLEALLGPICGLERKVRQATVVDEQARRLEAAS